MYLTLTNTTPEPEAIGDPQGSWTDVLQSQTAYSLQRDDVTVAIIGDKPDVRDQFKRAAQVLEQTARKLLTLIAGRKLHAADAGAPEMVSVAIANHGTNPVRVLLGDGTHSVQVLPGKTLACTARGYLELRELGVLDDSQVDGGTQPAIA
jgi:hypothetical protein